MIRKKVIGNATLYCGDCLEILPALSKVDAVVTDPPYDPNTHKNSLTNGGTLMHGIKGGRKQITFAPLDDFRGLCDSLVAMTNRWVVITCSHQHAPLVFEKEYFIRLGAWVKDGPMPQISGDRPGQGHEAVVCLHRPGKKRWNRGGRSGIWRGPPIKNPRDKTEVPSQKPEWLAEAFLGDFTDTGEIILDPFMGSGTTGVACMNLNRKFIGIEIEPKYFEISCERIEQAQRQGRLFA